MSPTKLPTLPKPRRASLAFISAAIVAFSLTLLAGGLVLLSGMLRLRGISATQRVDAGAVLLFVPVCALVLGIFAEAIRVALKSPLTLTEPPRRSLDWSPGHREG